MALPINVTWDRFLKKGVKTPAEIQAENQKNATGCSQQATVNQAVVNGMMLNPNVQPVQQQPAKQ